MTFFIKIATTFSKNKGLKKFKRHYKVDKMHVDLIYVCRTC